MIGATVTPRITRWGVPFIIVIRPVTPGGTRERGTDVTEGTITNGVPLIVIVLLAARRSRVGFIHLGISLTRQIAFCQNSLTSAMPGIVYT
jgi:hypothetical protein